MANRTVEHDMTSYGAMIAQRLRELRDAKRWSIDDFRFKLAEHGIVGKDGVIPRSTAYSYELGTVNSGATISVDLFPVIARIYGFSSPREWLPENWPSERALLDNTFPCP